MSFRSLASLRVAVSLSALLVLSACSDSNNRPVPLSEVDVIEVPEADTGPQANQNIDNPTLEIPETFQVADGDELTLVWSEEFDGPEIDPEVWFFESGDGSQYGFGQIVGKAPGWGNNELQYYVPDNAMIVNGVLEITARRETVGNYGYTSARINTQDRFAFQYGRIEASIKLPAGQGLWPAFWMLSQDSQYLCDGEPCVWAATGEIDIGEAVNLDGTGGNEIFGTIHYGGEETSFQNTSSGVSYTPGVDVTEDFHTYALEWDENEIRWYFNGQLYAMENSWSSTADNGGNGAPFNQPFHILLNVAVGGDFPGSPNGTTPFPSTMEVDWVRVYSGEPPPADPGVTPENAVFVTDPDAVATLAPAGLDNFGSGATFNTTFAGDADFKPTLQVTSGEGYGAGLHVGFVAFVGYNAGFAAGFETFSFKVKGLPGDELEVKFFAPDSQKIINLSTYEGSTELGNGWYQVTIPISDFAASIDVNDGFLIGPPGDQGAPFSFLLTDIGFDGMYVNADPGTIPEVSLYDRGGMPDLVIGADYTEFSGFDSGSVFNQNDSSDRDFRPAFAVTTGNGYGAQVGQLAYVGFNAGFAAAYETLDFKVKGMNNNIIRLKLLEAAPSDYVDITLTSSSFATALGNGWFQVSVPISSFGNAATADALLFETDNTAPSAFTFLLTDIGFSVANAGGELLVNGDLEAGQSPWIGQATVVDDAGNSVLQGLVTNPDPGQPFLVNASQVVNLTADETYTLTFRAKASVARTMLAGIGLNVGPFTNVTEAVPLTTEWQAFTYTLTATGFGGADSRVLFDMNGEAGDVFIDDVSLKVGSLLTNGDLEAGQAPWLNQATVVDDAGNAVLQGVVTNPDPGQPFLVNASQVIELVADEKYVLTFKAKASVARGLIAGIGLNVGPFTNTTDTVALGTAWGTFTCTLTATGFGGADSRVLFDMNAEAGDVFLDDIALALLGPTGIPTVDGCAGGASSGGGELLTNGDFEASATDKAPWINAGVIATNNFYQAEQTAPGQPAFTVNLSQVLPVTQDEVYVLTFKANASVDRTMLAGLGLNVGPFTAVTEVVSLTTDWQMFSYTLTATGFGGPDSRVLFDMGADVGEVNIDDVSLALSSAPGSNLLTNGDFEASATDKAPWINAGVIATNNFYQAEQTAPGQPAFTVNLSQVLPVTQDEVYVLTFKANASVDRTMLAGLGLNVGPFTAVTEVVSLTTDWQTFSYTLTATGFGGPDSRVLFDMGAEVGEVNIDDVSLTVQTTGGGGAAGELAVNGGFETGGFDDWQQAINSGLQSISTDTPANGGSFSAALSGNTAVGAGGTTEIKQANLGSGGALAVGNVLTIQFDVKGTFGPGGQLNVLSFTEFGGGGADLSNNTTITGGVDNWTNYNYDVTLSGSDASGGFSLAFNPVCGAVAGCFADVLIDNVSIVVN